MEEKATYGYEALTVMPPHMAAWGNYIEHPLVPSLAGEYVLVDAQPALVEQQHQVLVIDENGDPLPGVRVNFTYPGGNGPSINVKLTKDLWRGRPLVMTGNSVLTDQSGYAEHTIGAGGETIFVYDVNPLGELLLPCPLVHKNIRINVGAGGQFEHAGVRLTFQRRRSDVMPEGDRLAGIEARLSRLEDFTGINE